MRPAKRWPFFRRFAAKASSFWPDDPGNMGDTMAMDSILNIPGDAPGEQDAAVKAKRAPGASMSPLRRLVRAVARRR